MGHREDFFVLAAEPVATRVFFDFLVDFINTVNKVQIPSRKEKIIGSPRPKAGEGLGVRGISKEDSFVIVDCSFLISH